jgi:hypothetical protein
LRDVEILNQESLHLALAMAPPPSGFGRLWARLEQEVVKDGGLGDDFSMPSRTTFQCVPEATASMGPEVERNGLDLKARHISSTSSGLSCRGADSGMDLLFSHIFLKPYMNDMSDLEFSWC